MTAQDRNTRRAELLAARDAYLKDQDIRHGWSGPEWIDTPAGRELARLERTARFAVTYEIVTPESAEEGDADERGFIEESATLRDAVEAVHATRTNHVDGVESIELDSSPCARPRSITISNGQEFETGARESRSLHIPAHVTRSSARRIARLVGVTPLALRVQSSLYAYGYDGRVIRAGDRVELHPGTDLWARGARFGTVTRMAPTSQDAVRVTLDAMPNAQPFAGSGGTFRRVE